jgi:hypothetical protein
MSKVEGEFHTGFRDAAGKAVFCGGDVGVAHVRAHELYDRGETALGRAWLGSWLAEHSGEGSAWVHLQFHQAVFELACGDWNAAFLRFGEHVLPAAAAGDDALTDAPVLLWQLRLAAPGPVDLPWQTLRKRALAHLGDARDPFVALHDLLAIAGAGDVESLDRWVGSKPPCDDAGPAGVLSRIALALRDLAAQAYRSAGESIERLLPELPVLGGSFAQQRLFAELARASRHAGSALVSP